MASYEVKVTATWWVHLEADSEAEASRIAHEEFLDCGIYDGVDEITVYEEEEEDEEDE